MLHTLSALARPLTRAATGLAAAALLAATAPAALAAEYKVGMLLPFSGVYAALGNDIRDGFNLALDTYGSELDGHTITVVEEDSEAKPDVGVTKTRKLVQQDQVDVMTGVVSSGVLAAIRDFLHSNQVPIVVSNAGNDEMTGERCSPYVIRVSFSNSQINRPMGQWLYDHGKRRVFIMAPDYAAGHQQVSAFAEAFKAAGGEVVGEAYPPFQNTSDYAPYVTQAQGSNADSIYVFFAGSEAINFVKAYAAANIKDKMPLFGSGFLTSSLYAAAHGEGGDGIVAGLNYVPTIDNPENAAFKEAFQARYDRLPSEYSVAGYDAGRVIIEGIKVAGDDKDALAQAMRNVSFNGPRGPLRIDPATNNIIQNIYIFENAFADGAATQNILEVAEAVQDEPNGCQMDG